MFLDSFSAAWQMMLGLDDTLVHIVLLSLALSGLACLLACVLGISSGAWLALVDFKGRSALITLLNTALALPSVVVGLVVYLLLSHSGPLGFLGWLFSFKAMVVAQTILVLPVVIALTRQLIASADNLQGEGLRALGAGKTVRGMLLVWNERFALMTVVLTGFGRAVSEVGAVMVVGGNIEGFTRVMTTAIALETSKGDLPMALALGMVLLGVVLVLNAAVSALAQWGRNSLALPAASNLSAQPTPINATPATTHPAMSSFSPKAKVPTGQVMLSFNNVNVSLKADNAGTRAVSVLHNIHFSLCEGERVALVGANGCGKTTLMRTIAGLVPIASNQSTMQWVQPCKTVLLAQAPKLLRLSVANHVRLAAWLAGDTWQQAATTAQAALKHLGIAYLSPLSAVTLSVGQSQRVALAQCLASRSHVLLLDEPTASLDPHAKREVESVVHSLVTHTGGPSLVFASHNLGQVKRLATRVIYILNGRIEADLPVQAFFDTHRVSPLPLVDMFLRGELS